MRKRKSTIIEDTVILLIITIISGFILGAVNKVTIEPILKARNQKNKAYNIIFEDEEYFDENEELIIVEAVNSALIYEKEYVLGEGCLINE